MKIAATLILLLVLCTTCLAQVHIDCKIYDPSPGNIEGEVRLVNNTSKAIKASVKRGNNAPQQYDVPKGQSVMLGYLVGTRTCDHTFSLVSWQ